MQDVLDRLRSGRLCYTTPFGAQLSGDSVALLAELPANSVDLFVTSPPFPLLRKRPTATKIRSARRMANPLRQAGADALKPTGNLVIDIGGAYQRGCLSGRCTSTAPSWPSSTTSATTWQRSSTGTTPRSCRRRSSG